MILIQAIQLKINLNRYGCRRIIFIYNHMITCIKCQKERCQSYFIKNNLICKTCLRKEVLLNKNCNKCKSIQPTTKYTIDKRICDDCFLREEKEIITKIRTCSKCKGEKDIRRFRKRICFDCYNKDRNRRIKEGVSKIYPTNKNKRKEWREKNKEKLKNYRNVYSSFKYKTDINYKLTVICRSFLNRCFYNKNNKRTFEILGYTSEKLKQRLEFQFTKNMNWGNYGSYWNIDHRKPINLFKPESPIHTINALSNLRPIIKEENYSKQNRFIS